MTSDKLLKFVPFSKTSQWNVKYFFSTQLHSVFPLSAIGDNTIHITEKTKLFNEPERKFSFLGISNETGMFDAYTEYGKNINQPYIRVQDGCLAYNPYRINVGSVGLKTPALKNEYISPAYVVFRCRQTLLPEYLLLVLKSSFFHFLIKENTTGSVRQTLSYKNLSKIEIPLPPLPCRRNWSAAIRKLRRRPRNANPGPPSWKKASNPDFLKYWPSLPRKKKHRPPLFWERPDSEI